MLDILIILFLTILNGVFAMSELALVSSRRTRLQQMAETGNSGARTALRLTDDPGRFLSTVQIGITLIGIFAGAFGGATIADDLGGWLDTFPALRGNGDTIAIFLVVIAITYLSLIVGELVPKRIALKSPERVAALTSRPMRTLSRIAAPAVWLLGSSTEWILKLIGLHGERESAVTEEEVKSMITEGTRTGVFDPREKAMIEGVLRLADRSARSVMVPRQEVVWLDLDADAETVRKTVKESGHSRFLVCQGHIDEVRGIVRARDMLDVAMREATIDLADSMSEPVVVHDGTPVLRVLDMFRSTGIHMAVVVDEYGSLEGIITLTDVMKVIAGDLPELGQEANAGAVRRADGSWLVDGYYAVDEFEDIADLRGLRNGNAYHTMAGFVLHHLRHVPEAGDSFVWNDTLFEVVDMDGHRIDKILVVPGAASAAES